MTTKKDLRLTWSAEELRSMNGLVEYLLTEAVKKRRKNFKGDIDDEKDE